jgi:pyrroloquinoline quinone (PQQ) biosynthesis protein C
MRYYTTTDDRVPACGVSRKWRSLARHERAGRYVFGIDVGVDGLGLDRDYVTSLRGLLPGTRFAVDAYVHFLREKTLLEAIAVISGHSAVQLPCPLYPR